VLGTNLLAVCHPRLRTIVHVLRTNLLAVCHPGLRPIAVLGALGAHLHALLMLRTGSSKMLAALHPLGTHLRRALLMRGKPAATATASAVEALGALMASATAASASAMLRISDLSAASATMAAARLGRRRGADGQCGDASGKKYPGHHNLSFRTGKTVRPAHRSNR
jgi:hypothetical protein